MLDIITFGSATCDIFLSLPKPARESREICFALGDKVEVGDWLIHSGGGGTNTACAFAKQGLKAAYLGLVGQDYFARFVLDDLKKSGACLNMVARSKDRPTAFSVVLSPSSTDRVILVAPGACHFLSTKDIDWSKIKKTKWFYLAPFYEQAMGLLSSLINFAKDNNIKVALNPSMAQIERYPEELKGLMKNVNVLLLNIKEASYLTGFLVGEERSLLEKIKSFGPDIVAMTKGEGGAVVFNGTMYYGAGIFPVEVRERTGAGDAFGAGFVAGLLQRDDIEYAIRLAMANSAGCLMQVGAKNGLLNKGEVAQWPALEIKKSL